MKGEKNMTKTTKNFKFIEFTIDWFFRFGFNFLLNQLSRKWG